jgi:hypothetical protein
MLGVSGPLVAYRGLRVRTLLLCADTFAPPPDQGTQPSGTERERVSYRAATTPCAGCHALFDPLGLPLENFDDTGAYRTTYPGGAPIDASTDLPEGLGDVANAAELGAAIAGSDLFLSCMAKAFLEYALAEGTVNRDDCRVAAIVDDYRIGTERSFTGLARAVLLSDAVNVRTEEP